MRNSKAVVNSFLIVSSIALSASAQNEVPANWQAHMQTLAKNVVNAFPFLYSGLEFKKPENKKTIIDTLKTLATTGHSLPVKSGEAMIGVEPLIQASAYNFKGQLEEAIQLYDAGDFNSSQKKVHAAVQNCFACHTAHQIGPRFPTTNAEVMGLATPNLLGKAVVFGSLRQFDGALQLIDKEGGRAIDKKSPTADELVKLYLVVALRSQQNFARATAFLKRFETKKVDPTLTKWLGDIRKWQTLTASNDRAKIAEYISKRKMADAATNGDSLFVVYLFESYFLHNQPLPSTSSAEQKAEAFRQLGDDYAGLRFSPFETLPEVYYRACAKAAPASATGKTCQTKVSGR